MLLRSMPIYTKLLFHPDATIRTRYRVGMGVALSVLLHVLFFWFVQMEMDKKQVQSSISGEKPPMQVSFVDLKPPAAPAPAKEIPPPKPATKKTTSQKKTPQKTPQKTQAVKTPAIEKLPPEVDMSTMLNAARERRRSAEAEAAQENAAARQAEQGPTGNEIAKANIAFQSKKKAGGQNGVFQILTKGPREATYAFYGWTSESRFSEKQVIKVDAGSGGDVELAIVNSMIRLIRQYYKGDFSWDSYRLGKVITLSARESDTAELQAFLMKEFFTVRR